MSLTVGLATIAIPANVALHEKHIGFLLDIEVFNLWPHMAPSFLDLPEWCRRAHEVENRVFEGAITDALRKRFEEITK